MTPKL